MDTITLIYRPLTGEASGSADYENSGSYGPASVFGFTGTNNHTTTIRFCFIERKMKVNYVALFTYG